MTIYNVSFSREDAYLKMTFMFGLVVIGNSVDNISQPKYLLIYLQLFLGASWIITGFLVHYALKHNDDHDFKDNEKLTHNFFQNENLSQFFGSGVVLINILQLSNWFT